MTDTGWYFYGITRRGSVATALAAVDREDEAGTVSGAAEKDLAPLQLLEFSELAAVVRSVRLDDFSIATLRERLQSDSAMETMVRSHNRVIDAFHARQAILPAKFGVVHSRAEDVLSALRASHDTLVRQLNQLEDREEWAVHLLADRALVSQRISNENTLIRHLREKRAAARPGRAYFLEQQIRDELQSATELLLSTLAQAAIERLGAAAADRQMGELQTPTDSVGEVEILRASFLVARESKDAFLNGVASIDESGDGLRCEYTGPWPPYSFAVWDNEDVR